MGRPVVIFDCNGLLVDSEPIVSAVLADALSRIGIMLPANELARRFHGRRPADVFAVLGRSVQRGLPLDFADTVVADTLRRLRTELRPVAHAAHALTWIRGPKAVASSSPIDRVRLSLEVTGLMRCFEPRLFSASEAARGKPAPPLPVGRKASQCRSGLVHHGRGFGRRRRRGQGRGHCGGLALSGAVLPRGSSPGVPLAPAA
jgi:beta-phosphoglucomutase-like phosphatase (HAD superfamily)